MNFNGIYFCGGIFSTCNVPQINARELQKWYLSNRLLELFPSALSHTGKTMRFSSQQRQP